jgi:hypothetical protein
VQANCLNGHDSDGGHYLFIAGEYRRHATATAAIKLHAASSTVRIFHGEDEE